MNKNNIFRGPQIQKGYGQRGEDIMNEGSFGLWSVISESFRVLDVISWS